MFDRSTDHGIDVMVARFVLLFLVSTIFRETSTEIDFKTVNVILKTNRQQFSIVCAENFAVKLLARWFHLSFERCDLISKVDKSSDHGKLLSIC